MLAYYLHDMSPFALKVWHSADGADYGIRWYGISYMAGFLAAYFILKHLARTGWLRIPVDRVQDLVLNCCIWGVLLGGRLGYILFYDPGALTDFSAHFPFWSVLKVWQGGMSAHGGVIGVILVLYFWSRKNKYATINLGDAACRVVPLGLLFGRLANFVNGELYGAKTTVAWAVKFPTELSAPTNGRIDPALARDLPLLLARIQSHIDAAMAKIGFATFDLQGPSTVTQIVQSPRAALPAGTPPATVAEISTATRHDLEAFLPARHPSQLYEAALEGAVLFLICWFVGRYFKKDGMASGAFLTFYPIMRIICEQYRIGSDPPQWLAWTHLSQGINLSIVMFLAGLTYWIIMMRRPGARNSGAAPLPNVLK
jgi:phosphatidylglycerol:prolipoprotein diacylglycerol transferase